MSEPGDKWRSITYPNGCLVCGQTRSRHVGRGLCSKHYKQWERGALVTDELTESPSQVAPETVPRTSPSGPGLAETAERRPGDSDPVAPTLRGSDAAPPLGPSGIRSLFAKKEKRESGPVLPPTREKRPGVTPKRVPAADLIESGWGALGGLVARSPMHGALGRYLQWQAPATGNVLDKALAGTLVDRKLVQPAVRAHDSLGAIGAILGPPILIWSIERDPHKAGVLLPILRAQILASLPTMVDAMKRQKVRDEKVSKSIRELFPDLPEGADPVEEILAYLFSGPTPTEAPTFVPEAESVPT